MSYFSEFFNQYENYGLSSNLQAKHEDLFLTRDFNEEDYSTTQSPFSYNCQNYNLRDDSDSFTLKKEDQDYVPLEVVQPKTKIFNIIKVPRNGQQIQLKSCDSVSVVPCLSQAQQIFQSDSSYCKLSEKNKRIIKREIAKNRKKSLETQNIYLQQLQTDELKGESFDQKTRKKMQQMIRNRISAQISRDRKKIFISQLEQENTKLKTENELLKKTLSELAHTQFDNHNTHLPKNQKLLKIGFTLTTLITLLVMANVSGFSQFQLNSTIAESKSILLNQNLFDMINTINSSQEAQQIIYGANKLKEQLLGTQTDDDYQRLLGLNFDQQDLIQLLGDPPNFLNNLREGIKMEQVGSRMNTILQHEDNYEFDMK